MQQRGRCAFTLLELMLVIGIIVLLMGFLASALGRASRSARQTASQQSAEAIASAVEQFRLEFGFLPPLVHDGDIVSAGDIEYQPEDRFDSNTPVDGPVLDRDGSDFGTSYDFKSVVVWTLDDEGIHFFRRRDGLATDMVKLPSGGVWDIDTAWDDRRYSRYALAYYLAGSLPRSVDGVAGSGMSRPMPNGWFEGIGYPVGLTRDRYQPTIDTDRSGISLRTGYARAIEAAEHGAVPYADNLTVESVYNLYDPEEQDRLTALVDGFGTAYRYYRWEHGRYDGTRLVVETTLDLNIPPILLDPTVLVQLENNDANAAEYDLTNDNVDLRNARFAIVGAGADGLFGTEPIEYIADQLNREDPGTDPTAVAQMRKMAMDDNVVALGR